MEQELHKFYEDDSVSVSYQIHENRAHMHCRVFDWKAKTLRKCYSILADMLNMFQKLDVVAAYTITPNSKFAELMGGVYCADITYEGKQYGVYKWDLIQLQSESHS